MTNFASMEIHYKVNGEWQVLEVPILEAAEHEEELMKSDFVKLAWNAAEKMELSADAYIIPFADGVRYSLLEPYKPEQKSEIEWHYEPHFQHPKMYLSKVTFVRPTKDSDANDITLIDWPFTGDISTLLGYFCDQINAVLGLQSPELFEAAIVGTINENVVSVQFNTQDIISALSNVANTLNCEWHLDWNQKLLMFGRVMYLKDEGDEVFTLSVGDNISMPSIKNSKDGYWNAFEPQGSTRNITRRAASGEYVQANVRLNLRNETYPDGIIYTDEKGNVITKDAFESSGMTPFVKSLIFEEVYPKLDLYAYNIRYRERILLEDESNPESKVIDHYDENNKPVYKKYAIWYMRLAYKDPITDVWTDYDISEIRKNITTVQSVVDKMVNAGDYIGVYLILSLAYSEDYFTTRSVDSPGSDSNPQFIVSIKANGITIRAEAYNTGGRVAIQAVRTNPARGDWTEPDAEKMNAFATAISDGDEIALIDGIDIKKFPVDYSQIIDGKKLYGQFKVNTEPGAESTPLAGRGTGDNGNYGFQLVYLGIEGQSYIDAANEPPHDASDTGIVDMRGNRAVATEKDYEIVIQQSGDFILPTTKSQMIIPKGASTPSILNNIVNLYNIVMDSTFEALAKKELEKETKKYIAKSIEDDNSYTFNSDPIAFERLFREDRQHNRNSHLYIGQKVNFVDGKMYTLGNPLLTRVMKVVTKMDYDFVQEITIGNEVIKGAQQTLKEQVQTLVSTGASGGNGGGNVSESTIRRIVENYVTPRFLSKINDDTANGLITLIKGIKIGAQKIFGWDSDGNITANNISGNDINASGNLNVGGAATVSQIGSSNYSGDGIADTGWRIFNDSGSGGSHAVFDYLTIRKKMIINSLEIKETHFTAGDIAQSCASAEIARTDYYHIDANGNYILLGYSKIKVPWLLRGMALILGKRANAFRIFAHYKQVRMTLTASQLEEVDVVRCYFLAKDGERDIENWWRANDLARCQTWNLVRESRQTFLPNFDEHAGNVYWWRKVKNVSWNTGTPRYLTPTGEETEYQSEAYVNEGGVARLATNGTYSTTMDEVLPGGIHIDHSPSVLDGNTYHWFDVEYHYDQEQDGQVHGWCDANSDIPAAGDKVVQFGNTTDPDRMNITLSEINGSGNADAPDIKMLRGVYTFDLNHSWWGGVPCKMKLSPATGYEFYGPHFRFITEYGVAKVPLDRPEKYWNSIELQRDDETRTKAINTYPDYSDDIKDEDGHFVSRGGFVIENGAPRYGSEENPIPKNYVRKCYYYERVSHIGSLWLCSISEVWYWRATQPFGVYSIGDKVTNYPSLSDENKAKCEHVRSYAKDEPTAASGEWTEQVEKGDEGAFKSRAFCRTNTDISSYHPQGGTNGSPIPTSTKDAQGHTVGGITWADGAPAGSSTLWSTTAWFYSDGTHSEWTPPARETDTEYSDVEFSMNYAKPGDPYSGSDFTPDKRGNGTRYGTVGTNSRANGSGLVADWYDPKYDNVDFTKMVWRAERRIKNGEYFGTWEVSRIIGEDAVRIDLSNENDSMLYSSTKTENNGLVSGSVTSTASLYYGSRDVSADATWQMTTDGCNISSGNSRNIVVTGMNAQEGYVNVKATYNDAFGAQYVRQTRLTLKKIVDGDKYDLVITPNSIAYNTSTDSPATSTITIQVWRMTCDGVRAMVAPPTSYATYLLDGSTRLVYSAASSFTYTSDNSARSSITVKIAKGYDSTDYLDCETIPVNKSANGTNGDVPMQAFQWNQSATTGPTKPSKGELPSGSAWKTTAPNRPTTAGDHFLWMTTASKVKSNDGQNTWTYTEWSNPVRISGDTGDAGEDSSDREWIYKRTDVYPFSETDPSQIDTGTIPDPDYPSQGHTEPRIPSNDNTKDDWVPTGWEDRALPAEVSAKYVYASWRDKPKGKDEAWGAFQTPILWSNWGVQGLDGDGVQYIYKLYPVKLTDAQLTSFIPLGPTDWNSSHEWLPVTNASAEPTEYKVKQWTDDPENVSKEYPYCYCSIVKEIGGAWQKDGSNRAKYNKLALWSTYSESSVRIDLDNQADLISLDSEGKVRFARTITVKARIFEGSTVAASGVTKATSLTQANLRYGNSTTGCTPTISNVVNGIVTITWAFTKGMVPVIEPKTIALKYNNQEYSAEFSLGTTNSDVIYQVLPNPSEVSFSRSSSNTLTPSSINLVCDYTKDTGSGTIQTITGVTNYQIDSSNYLYYRVKGSNGSWGRWTAYAGAIPISNSTTDTDYEFAISTVSSDPSDSNIYEREVVPIVKDGINGTSPFIVDSSNDMDSVACDNDLKAVVATNIYSQLMAFYGQNDETAACQVKYTSKPQAVNLYLETSGSGTTTTTSVTTSYKNISTSKFLRINVAKNAQLAERQTVELMIKHATYGEQSLIITILGLKGGATYRLIPSANVITKSTSNTYTPSSLTCVAKKLDVATGSETSLATTSITYTKDGESTENNYATLTPGTSFTSYVTFILKVGGVIVDKETVNIVKDGEKGDDAVIYLIEPTVGSIKIPSDSQSAALSCGCAFYKREGSGQKTAFSTRYTVYTRSGSTFTMVSNGNDDGCNISTTVTTQMDAVVIYLFSSQYTGTSPESQAYLAKTEILVNKSGDDGKYKLSAYKASNTTPAKPSGTSVSASALNSQGWYLNPSEASGTQVTLTYTPTGTWTRSGNTFTSPPSTQDYGYYQTRISFTTSSDNIRIRLRLTASSEANCDFGYIGRLDTDLSSSVGNNYIVRASGTESVNCVLNIAEAGSHYFDIVYSKDRSKASGNDNAIVEILGAATIVDQIWESETWVSKDSGGTEQALGWSDPVEWNGLDGLDGKDGKDGQDGQDGQDGADGFGYALLLIRNGSYTDSTWDTYGTLGTTRQFAKVDTEDFTVCRVGDLFMVSGTSSDSGSNHSATYLCTVVSSSSIGGICQSYTKDGRTGDAGKTGRFYYYAGVYIAPPSNYKMQETQAPFVKDGNDFWMLDFKGEEPSRFPADATDAPSNNSRSWTKMASEQQYYIAKAFFGEDAQFGSFIISGDWMISTEGTVTLKRDYTVSTTYDSSSDGQMVNLTAKATGQHTITITAGNITGTVTVRLYRNSSSSSYLQYVTLNASNPTKTMTANLTAGQGYVLCAFKASSSVSATISLVSMVAPNGYLYFVGTDPTGQNAQHFAPNFAVDGMTGKSYQNDAYIKGEIHAVNGEFSGTVKGVTGTFTTLLSSDDLVGLAGTPIGSGDLTWRGLAVGTSPDTMSGVDYATIGARFPSSGTPYGRLVLTNGRTISIEANGSTGEIEAKTVSTTTQDSAIQKIRAGAIITQSTTLNTDRSVIYVYDGNINLYLPSASDAGNGFMFYIFKQGTGSAYIYTSTSSSNYLTKATVGNMAIVISNGSTWWG